MVLFGETDCGERVRSCPVKILPCLRCHSTGLGLYNILLNSVPVAFGLLDYRYFQPPLLQLISSALSNKDEILKHL